MRTLMQCAQAALTYSPDDASIISDAAEELDRLRAENERLRARVEVLEKALSDVAEYCCDADPTISTVEFIARRGMREIK